MISSRHKETVWIKQFESEQSKDALNTEWTSENWKLSLSLSLIWTALSFNKPVYKISIKEVGIFFWR